MLAWLFFFERIWPDFLIVSTFLLSFEKIFYTFETTDGKYLVLPSGELHIREVGPEDGYKSYQCRTKHRLTGEARLSATKGRLVITGNILWYYNLTISKKSININSTLLIVFIWLFD